MASPLRPDEEALRRAEGRARARADGALRSVYRSAWLWQMRRRVGAHRFAAFGSRSVIVPPAVVRSPHRIHIGEDVLVHDRAWFSIVEEHRGQRFEPRLRIGDGTVFGRDAYFACVGAIDIGRNVLAADRVFITDTYHDYRDVRTPILNQRMVEPRPVKVADGAFLGVGAIVLAGVTIGAGAYVGAGAVVTEDVPPHSVVVGNPARVVRQWDAGTADWRDGVPAP